MIEEGPKIPTRPPAAGSRNRGMGHARLGADSASKVRINGKTHVLSTVSAFTWIAPFLFRGYPPRVKGRAQPFVAQGKHVMPLAKKDPLRRQHVAKKTRLVAKLGRSSAAPLERRSVPPSETLQCKVLDNANLCR